MTHHRHLSQSSPNPAPAYIGPLFRDDAVFLRYGAAIVIVLLIAVVRALLAPLLGTEAPLLPFVLGVFASAYLGGRTRPGCQFPHARARHVVVHRMAERRSGHAMGRARIVLPVDRRTLEFSHA